MSPDFLALYSRFDMDEPEQARPLAAYFKLLGHANPIAHLPYRRLDLAHLSCSLLDL
jgi:hypothetical protein